MEAILLSAAALPLSACLASSGAWSVEKSIKNNRKDVRCFRFLPLSLSSLSFAPVSLGRR